MTIGSGLEFEMTSAVVIELAIEFPEVEVQTVSVMATLSCHSIHKISVCCEDNIGRELGIINFYNNA